MNSALFAHLYMNPTTTIIRATTNDGEYTGDVVMVRATTHGALATVAFAKDFPSLMIGESIDLSVQGSAGVTFQGKLVFQGRVDGGSSCQLLVGPAAIAHLNPRQNSREIVRVRPSATQPASATIGNQNFEVYDISTGGVALLIPTERQRDLPKGDVLRFSLKLPGGRGPLDLVGNLIHRRLVGSAVVYGVQFDQRATDSFAEKEVLIQEYVMQRQHELLRDKREDS